MLSIVAADTDGRRHILSSPLSLTIRMDEKVPADDLYAVLAYEPVGELTQIGVYDADRRIFVGVVDEQEHFFGSQGRLLRISARSLAAHLLDNEAAPQCYDHPYAMLIYERHVRPYGIVWDDGDDATFFGEQMITKGMSQWAAVKNFCVSCFSALPRVTADGALKMKGFVGEESVCFSDSGGGIRYTELCEFKKRCEEISRVNVKVTDDGGYSYPVENSDALSRGVRRERYLNAVLASTPMTCADAMLRSGEAASYGIRLKCPGCLADKMGYRASVKNREIGEITDLYISSVSYRMDENGDGTTLLLKRR